MGRAVLAMPIAAVLALAAAAACSSDVDEREVWETPEYEQGYEAGREAGYDDGREDGYSAGYGDGYDTGHDEGYSEGQDDFLDCAERYATDLYYGGDEYYAVPIDELAFSCQ